MVALTGISDHIGWAEFVTLGVEDKRPVILDRRRVQLIQRGIPSAPYHHECLELPLDRAKKLVDRTWKSVDEHSRSALSEAISSYGVKGIVLQESPIKRLPLDLAHVLASRRITCAADGMMYRESLAAMGAQLGLQVSRYPRRSDEVAAAAQALGVNHATVEGLLTSLGRTVGVPWRKEHQIAAAGALRVLASMTPISL
jgi:hypothetical protein